MQRLVENVSSGIANFQWDMTMTLASSIISPNWNRCESGPLRSKEVHAHLLW